MHDVNPNTTSALFFTVDGQQYALDIAAVQAVVPVLEIRALPGAPSYIPGVISYRGCIVPIIDISKMLSGTPASLFYCTRIAIVDYPASTGSRLLGLLIEQATKSIQEVAGAWEPTGVATTAAPCLAGIAEKDGNSVQLVTLDQLLPESVQQILFPT